MIADIVPYPQEDAMILGRSLAKMGVHSIGPGTCMALLRIADGIQNAKKDKRLSPEMIGVLESYRLRLMDVCNVSAGQQQEIIATIEKAIKP